MSEPKTPQAKKPPALRPQDDVRVLSLASPVQEELLKRGCDELTRLGFAPKVDCPSLLARESFFAGPPANRLAALKQALSEPNSRAIFCSRGGYGTNYLLDGLESVPATPKILLGASDITSLQVFLWQRHRWVTFYGPMVASNFHQGAGASQGYDRESLLQAVTQTNLGWTLDLEGESLAPGSAEGVLLGGCLTLIETSLGTPWELDTQGAILALEDRGMKPYQVDRALMHLKQAGKLDRVAGVILGDFPDCQPPAGGENVRDVARRILAPPDDTGTTIPVIWGAPIGHTSRAALTLPLGVRARLVATAAASAPSHLDILEPACSQ
jgi:muramoyltetrapeptide carboxypeptidase